MTRNPIKFDHYWIYSSRFYHSESAPPVFAAIHYPLRLSYIKLSLVNFCYQVKHLDRWRVHLRLTIIKSMVLLYTTLHLCFCWYTLPMELIFDGNSEIGVHVRNNLGYLICLRPLLESRAVGNTIFLKTYFPLCLCNIFWVTSLI